MWPFPAHVARTVVGILGTPVSCAKTDEPIEMLLGMRRLVWAKENHVWGLDPLREEHF